MTKRHKLPIALTALFLPIGALLLVFALTATVGGPPGHVAAAASVVDTVTVGSGPYGVWVNATTNKIYVTHNADRNVLVIDGTTNALLDTNADTIPDPAIDVGAGPASVAVNATTNMIYVANAGDNNV